MPNKFMISAEANYSPGASIHLDTAKDNVKAVFMDDGASGKFLVMENNQGRYQTLDSLQVYSQSAGGYLSRGKMLAQIAWSRRGGSALFLLNQQPLAVFDFTARAGYANLTLLNGQTQWTRYPQPWRPEILDAF